MYTLKFHPMRSIILSISLLLIFQLASAQPFITANVVNMPCINSTGSIDIEVSGGCPQYSYEWSVGGTVFSTEEDLSGIGLGTYTVEVSDCDGNMVSASFTVIFDLELLVDIQTSVGCIDEVTVSGGCPPYSIEFLGNTITSVPICGLPEIWEIVYITDACDCMVWDTINLGQALPLIIEGTVVDPGCLGDSDGSIDISVQGGTAPYTYLWSHGATTEDVSNLPEGSYAVTVTDAIGNMAVEIFSLLYTNATDLEVVATIEDAACTNTGGSISLEVTGGCAPYFYSWSNNNSSSTLNDLAPGIYTITILDCTGCGVVESFTVNGPSSINIEVQTSPGCIDWIDITGGCFPYQVDINGIANTNNFPFCGLAPGDYEVQVTDACGCTATLIVVIEPGIILNIEQIIYPSCNGAADGAIDISVSGGVPGYTFAWNTGASTEDIANIPEGIYTVTVTDTEANSTEMSINLSYDGVQLDHSNITCESVSGNDGAIQINVSGGEAPYAYSWSNGVTSQNVDNLISGVYYLTIEDANGCESNFPPFFVCHDSMQLNMDTLVCAGTEVLLDVQFDDSITFLGWADPDNNEINCDACPVTSVFPHESRTYTAQYNSPVFGDFNYQFDIEVIAGCVWPGDTDSSTVVDLFDLFPILLEYGTTGPARTNPDIDWYGHMAPDYGVQMVINNIDAKHADSNGDGIINLDDGAAILANWGDSHKSLTSGKKGGTPVFIGQDTIYETGATISLPVIIGTMDTMAADIYAIGFSINFDPEIMVDGTASLELNNSWFSEGSVPMGIVQKEFAEAGRLDVAIGRTDLMNVSGNGQVADFIITMEDDILKAELDKEFEISVDNVRMINIAGEEIDVQGLTTTSLFVDSTAVAVTDLAELNKRLFIFPNPARAYGEIQVVTTLEAERYELININGKTISSGAIRKGNNTLQLADNLSSGLYIIQIDGAFGRLSRKLIIE